MAASRELLRDAIAIWRDTRDEAIADAVDRLTGEMLQGWQPPAPRLQRAFHAAWLEAASDDVTRGWAAQQLLEKLPDRQALPERLRALAAAGPDPRVGRAMIAQLAALRPRLVKEPALEPLVHELLAMSADGDELADAKTGLEDGFLIDRVLALPRPTRRLPTPRELAYLAAAPSATEAAPLRAAVYAHPDDDTVRAVLADALQTAGDPRGELIALQLAAETSEAQRERVAELMRDHGRGWLGPLGELASSAWFARGFLAGLELRAWTGGEARWQQLLDEPLLGTVEDLGAGSMQGERYAQLVTSPRMTALRRIEVFDPAVVAALEVADARLVHIACSIGDRGVRWLADAVLPACVRFETLRSFACTLEGVPAVLGSPIGARLSGLTVTGELPAGLAFWRGLRRPLELAFVERPALRYVLPPDALHLRREAGRTIARVSGPWSAITAHEHWDQIAADRLELTTEGHSPHLEQLARGRCDVVRLPPRRSRYGIAFP